MNGEPVYDLSSDNIKVILDKLKNLKVGILDSIIDKVKKNIDDELKLYFPQFFDDVYKMKVYDMLKKRTMLVLESISQNKDNSADVDKKDEELLSMSKPKSFEGKESVEIKHNKQFESTCIMITQHLGLDAKKLTTFSYYSAMEQLKKQAPKNKIK